MAKDNNEPYKISAQQLYESRRSRDLITGCLSLDIGLGGGIPMGCTVVVGGKQGAGKTTIVLQYAANAQNKFKAKVFYFNIEARLDNKILNQIQGIKLGENDFTVIMGTPILDKDDKVIGNKKMSAEWWWGQISEVIHNNPHSIIIVDSIGVLTDEKEMSEGLGYQGRGNLQKLEAQFCRLCGDMVVPSNITLFVLAHIQANTSGYGEAMQIKCGNALKHTADAMIFCKNFEKWKPSSEGSAPSGQDIICRVDKSPLGQPFLETKIPLKYGYGIDDIQDVVNHAINWELIKAAASWYTLPFIEKDGKFEFIQHDKITKDQKPVKLQGEAQIREWLMKNPTQYQLLDSLLRKQILGT